MKKMCSISYPCIFAFFCMSFLSVNAISSAKTNDNDKKKSTFDLIVKDANMDLIMPSPTLPELVFGRDEAKSTVVVYLSFTCEYCKKFFLEELPTLKKSTDNGDIKICIRPFIDTDTSREATALIKCLCGNSKERLLKLFSLAFNHQDALIKIKNIDDLYNFLKTILPSENISRELIIECKKNQKIYSGIMIDHYKTTYNSEISSAPAFIIGRDRKTFVHQGFLKGDEIKQKIEQIKQQIGK